MLSGVDFEARSILGWVHVFGGLVLIPGFAYEISGSIKSFVIGATVYTCIVAGVLVSLWAPLRAPESVSIVK